MQRQRGDSLAVIDTGQDALSACGGDVREQSREAQSAEDEPLEPGAVSSVSQSQDAAQAHNARRLQRGMDSGCAAACSPSPSSVSPLTSLSSQSHTPSPTLWHRRLVNGSKSAGELSSEASFRSSRPRRRQPWRTHALGLLLLLVLGVALVAVYLLLMSSALPAASAGLQHAERSLQAAGCASPADEGVGVQAAASHQLVVVVPFVAEDVEHLVAGLHGWAALGPACSPRVNRTTGGVSLRFFHPKTASAYRATGTPLLDQLLKAAPELAANVTRCFDSIETVFAALTPAQDGYPAGPSNMFFMLMLQLAAALLPAFTHMFWMEWDVRPVRPFWLDRLQAATHGEAFWMKGSRYRGRAFDEVVKTASAWSWVGHLNGNALYRLHDPDFHQLLRLIVEQEPPSHWWKPFDVSIWKTLHDFPYSWHLYQMHADRFQTTAVMEHLGFTVWEAEVSGLVSASPQLHLVHGDRRSAGTTKYFQKFNRQGVPRTNQTLQWADEVTAALRISVLCRTSAWELPFAALALTSAKQYFPGALELVAVVPERDLEQALAALPAFVTVVAEMRQLRSDSLQQQLTMLTADSYVEGLFVFHLRPDQIFHRPLRRRDLFLFNRPLISFSRVAASGGRSYGDRLRLAGTAHAIGADTGLDFYSLDNQLFHRSAYEAARKQLESAHQTSWLALLESWQSGSRIVAQPDDAQPSHHPGVDGEVGTFSARSYLGAFLYLKQADSMSWMYSGSDSPAPQHSLAYAYTPVRPSLLCQANVRLYRRPHWQREFDTQLAILGRLARGESSGPYACGELQGFITANPYPE